MASILRAAATAAPRRLASSSKREFSALLTPVEEFPGLPSTTPEVAQASSASVTTLPNGLTVVSENASSASTIALTFPNAGSSSEASEAEAGAALANKYLCFKSGSGLSSAVILRNMENAGASPFVEVSRDGATVGYTASREKAIHLMPLLATTCSFEKWDVKDAMTSAKYEINQASVNAQTVLTESIFSAAYGAQSSIGKKFYSGTASAPLIKSFRERAYVLNGAVLSATGIQDHATFVQAVEESLSESIVGETTDTPSAVYNGGETRIHVPGAGHAHVALAFSGPASTPLSDVIRQCIHIVSGGTLSGFTANGGLIGAYASSSAGDAGASVDAICAAFTGSLPSVDAEVVERAKGLAKANALFALEDGSKSLAESMTASILENGSFGAADVSASYDAVTVADVKAAVDSIVKSNPALAAVGDISTVPYQGSIASRFA